MLVQHTCCVQLYSDVGAMSVHAGQGARPQVFAQYLKVTMYSASHCGARQGRAGQGRTCSRRVKVRSGHIRRVYRWGDHVLIIRQRHVAGSSRSVGWMGRV